MPCCRKDSHVFTFDDMAQCSRSGWHGPWPMVLDALAGASTWTASHCWLLQAEQRNLGLKLLRTSGKAATKRCSYCSRYEDSLMPLWMQMGMALAPSWRLSAATTTRTMFLGLAVICQSGTSSGPLLVSSFLAQAVFQRSGIFLCYGRAAGFMLSHFWSLACLQHGTVSADRRDLRVVRCFILPGEWQYTSG